MKIEQCRERGLAEPDEEAVGIVVSNGTREARRPRAVAFVWGRRTRAVPSLPYGRWKDTVRPAA